MHDNRKRCPDVNVIANSAKTTKIKNFDDELWCACATKAVDSERKKKRHEDNEQVS